MMHDGSAITPTTLVALPQPQQGNDLLSGKVALGQGVDVRGTCLFVCCAFTIFFMSNVWVHLSILSPCAVMMSGSKRAPYRTLSSANCLYSPQGILPCFSKYRS